MADNRNSKARTKLAAKCMTCYVTGKKSCQCTEEELRKRKQDRMRTLMIEAM